MFEDRTEQEMFDTAVKGLAEQNFKRSIAPNRACVYRSQDGKRCALGHILTDDDVRVLGGVHGGTIEGESATSLLVHSKENVPVEKQAFLEDLQCAHDYAENAIDMRIRLQQLGEKYDLTLPPELGGQEQ